MTHRDVSQERKTSLALENLFVVLLHSLIKAENRWIISMDTGKTGKNMKHPFTVNLQHSRERRELSPPVRGFSARTHTVPAPRGSHSRGAGVGAQGHVRV